MSILLICKTYLKIISYYRASKVELKDKPVAVDSLKQLEDRGLITQVASGVWMRAVTCVDEQQHGVYTFTFVFSIY